MNNPYQDQNNECQLNKYCNDDCGACSDKNKAEKIARIDEELQTVVSNISEVLAPAIQETAKTITGLWRSVIECYPNRRVVYLALDHPKEKVRKKNTQRIMRWLRNEHPIQHNV